MKIGGGADPWAGLRGEPVSVVVRCGLPRHRDSEPCRNERETCRWHGTGRGATRARLRGTGPGRQPAYFITKPNSRDVPGFSGRPEFSASRSGRRRPFSRSEGRGTQYTYGSDSEAARLRAEYHLLPAAAEYRPELVLVAEIARWLGPPRY